MSPTWLINNAEFLETPSTQLINSITFGNGTTDFQRLFNVIHNVPVVSGCIIRVFLLWQARIVPPDELTKSAMYIVSVKFWKVPITDDDDHDFGVALCDSTHCLGFRYNDYLEVYSLQFNSSSSTCVEGYALSPWETELEDIWDIRFELYPSHTLAITWNYHLDKGISQVYLDTVLDPSMGLNITICRDNYDEIYVVKFFEVTVRKM